MVFFIYFFLNLKDIAQKGDAVDSQTLNYTEISGESKTENIK